MSPDLSFKERLRQSLRRTRERLTPFRDAGTVDWDALEESLVLADVGIAATSEILDRLKSRSGPDGARLDAELVGILREVGSAAEPEVARPRVVMIVGVNGVGKTTTVAKLARRSVESGEKTLVVAADTFRAAAQEQLKSWAERIGADIVEGEAGRDPASIVHDGLQSALGRGIDTVFIDTAGRLHTKRPLMDELKKIARVASSVVERAPHETLLVMDATVGSNGLAQAREFAAALGLTGIVLTKMDGTAKGGVVLAIARELGVPVRDVGVGEGGADLIPFDPEEFVSALLDSD